LIKEIELNVMVNNLFNSLYESNGWTYSYFSGGVVATDNYYYPQAGANFMAGIRFKL
jgi:iron complex outermembrane recepter protein